MHSASEHFHVAGRFVKVKAVAAYDGSAYNGFQKQINGTGIQDVLEKALEKIHKNPTSITASGRTDAKVHALGQVFHFEGNPKISMESYYQALNTLLPKDIRIVSCQIVPDDFHARFSAVKKRYEYIYTKQKDNPFIWRYKTPCASNLDLKAMREAAAVFIGEHDFTSFSNAKIDPAKSRIKRIDSIEIFEEGQDIRLVFIGNGFLRYQVRMMTAVLMEAARGKLNAEQIRKMLEAKDKEVCRYNAPPQGLYLAQVIYSDDEPKNSPKSL